MKSSELYCWKCKAPLGDVLLPFSRLAKCKACKVDLHVCRMCSYFDTTVSNSCREPIAEKVSDKKRANFCGYFQPAENKNTKSSEPVSSSKTSLEALFGLEKGTGNLSTNDADTAQQQLENLFGLDDKKSK